MLKTTVDKMQVVVCDSNAALGQQAAADFSDIVKRAVAEQGDIAVIFATGNSQLSFLSALRTKTDIPWNRISAFHMDEYLGIAETHPGSFRRFLREKLTDVFQPREMFGMRGDAPDIQQELVRYTALLEEHKPVLVVMGIGENGHIAFNDPPADFKTREIVHIVSLDEKCRRQQVGEGHFATLGDVPTKAISLTVHALLQPLQAMALVPEARKAPAIKAALEGPVTESCPASILRTQAHIRLYLDQDSASLVKL